MGSDKVQFDAQSLGSI